MKTDIKIILPGDKPLNIDLSQEDLNWELEEIDEREMGVERLYEAVLVKDVEDLDEPLEITLRVWEYPEGFANMQEIELSEGNVVEECDLGQFVISYYEEDDDYDGEDEP
jgi:hypothetical protein